MSRAASRSRTIKANGLSTRPFRSRSLCTARVVGGIAGQVKSAQSLNRHDSALGQILPRGRQGRGRVAASCSTGRWKAASSQQASPATSHTCGPHFGQALGWAWKRRSARIVVLALARGAHAELGHRRQRTVVRHVAQIVKRGPQFVQLING